MNIWLHNGIASALQGCATPEGTFATWWHPDEFMYWEDCLTAAGDVLKNRLRAMPGEKAKDQNLGPLGNANPRHASAVHLRPVRVNGNTYRLLLWEAPHDRVLPLRARRSQPLLNTL